MTVLIIFRLIPHPPNFSPIIAFAMMSPTLIKDKIFSTFIVILSIFITDFIIGFHVYQLVIYLTLISIILISPLKINIKVLVPFAIMASFWFFLTTNFAVWVLWDFYEKNIQGLITCYTLALPFFTNTLMSTLFFSILIYFLSTKLDNLSRFLILYFKKII